MKGIVLSSDPDNNKSVVLTDEGIVKTINGTFETGKKVNIRPASKKGPILKIVSIVLGTCAVLLIFTLGSLYVIGRSSDSDDSSAISSSQGNSDEGESISLNGDTSSTTDDENTLNDSSESEDIADDNSGSEDSSSDSDNATTDDSNTAAEGTSNIPDAPPSANDGTTPPEIPEGGQSQGPQGGQTPSGQAPDGQQPGTMGEAQTRN